MIAFSTQCGVARRPLRDSWRCSGCVLYTKGLISPPLRQNCKPIRSFARHVKKMKSVDLCVPRIGAELPLRPRPDLMLPNNFHCPLSTGGGQITMPMHRYKSQFESPEAKCPRLALIGCRMRSRALCKLQMHTIAPKGYRMGQVRSYLSANALRHPKSSLKARARANGNGVDVGGRGEGSKPWGVGIVIRKHYIRLSPVCGSIAWAAFLVPLSGHEFQHPPMSLLHHFGPC